ncbi:AraC family transcriptional regulator [Halomonas sp. GT]|uniref:AraC family transcriptional regulator n=1 Tax=Halomonas sp. GT TaxID=1971364 RepID=UPI0009F6F607|nr:AraC family transcriptional regulator [Halomonas sp. GT]
MPQQQRASTPEITSQALVQLGQRFGIHYRIEDSPSPLGPVALGHVHDVSLSQALHLTLSDLQVERTYTSTSYQSVPWFISVILEGEISAQLGETPYRLKAGDGFCAHFDAQHPIIVRQPAQPRLRTVNLAVLATAPLALPIPPHSPQFQVWQLPTALRKTLCTTIDQPPTAWRQSLLWQGLALQLLGLGLPEQRQQQPKSPKLSQRDQRCITALHQKIAEHPEQRYHLQTLAKEAAMSPSSLRQKFHSYYGCSIFEHLRASRLQKAYRDLEKGFSVQQAAHACGYRHASNFATAFKRQFGMTPHSMQK